MVVQSLETSRWGTCRGSSLSAAEACPASVTLRDNRLFLAFSHGSAVEGIY